MATVQITDCKVKIEPEIIAREYQFGPSDYVAANAVMLTRDNLRRLGAYPPREGQTWDCHLWIYWVVSGVEEVYDLSGISIAGSYWDPVSEAATSLTVAHGAGTGQITLTVDSPTPKMYKFAIWGTQGADTFDLCSGWLEIMPGHPAP